MFGDVVGSPGRVAILERIQDLREQHRADLVIMNAENVAGGFSITPHLADRLFSSGVDVMTSGNHIFDKREIIGYLDEQPRLLRPANYPPGTPGSGVWTGEVAGTGVAVINIMGRLFMPPVDDPFRAVDAALASLNGAREVRIVDMHAEATSEKAAIAWYVDGRVSAVVGTHTHVQTADERILPGGTAFLTDVGMTGSYSGVIGMEREAAIARFRTVTAKRAENSSGGVRICAVLIDVDGATGRARSIARLSMPHES